MDLYEKFTPERTPLRMLTVEHGPIETPLYKAAERYLLFPRLEGELGNRMVFNNKECIVWSINNYAGLANNEYLRKKEREACNEWSIAYPMGARMFSGDTLKQHEIEAELSDFVRKEASLLLNYGYQGMLSLIDALTDIKDVVIYDSGCHACIVDGVRLHPGKRMSFLHNNISNLEKQLEKAERMTEKSGGGILVITEGVFGMSGDQGKLKEMIQLKEKIQFRLLVDDAHGFGTMGKTGAGIGEAQGVQDGIDLYFATFAKSIASIGAFVSGDKEAIDFIRFGIRSQMFAKTLPMLYTVSNLERLRYFRSHPEILDKLWANAKMLREGFEKIGLDLGKSNSQIIPVYLNTSIKEGVNLIIELREKYKIFCSGALYPVVPMGVFLLRLIPTAAHTQDDVLETIKAFKEVKAKLDQGMYKNKLDEQIIMSVLNYANIDLVENVT